MNIYVISVLKYVLLSLARPHLEYGNQFNYGRRTEIKYIDIFENVQKGIKVSTGLSKLSYEGKPITKNIKTTKSIMT